MSTAGWFAQNAPAPTPPPAAPPQGSWFSANAPAQPGAGTNPPKPSPVNETLTDNSRGEGTYTMANPAGAPSAIPYSKVDSAHKMGFRFANQQDRTQYARDFAADPVHEDAIDRYLKNAPWYDPAANAAGILEGIGGGVEGTAAGLDRIVSRASGEHPVEALQDAAARPDSRWSSGVGGAGEAAGEFFTGEELLGLIGRTAGATGEAIGVGDRLKQAQQLANLVNSNSKIAKLIKIGSSAVKNFTLTGGQTYAKTGGDTGAAVRAGVLGAGVGAAGEAALGSVARYLNNKGTTLEDVAGEKIPIAGEARNIEATPAQAAGKRAITTAARSTAQAHLGELNEALTPPKTAPQLPAQTGPFEFSIKGLNPVEGATNDLLHPAAKFEPAASQVPQGAEPGAQNAAELGSQAATVPARMLKRTQAYTSAPEGTPEIREDIAKGGGVLKTQDPNIAIEHVSNLNKVIDSPAFDRMTPQQQQQLLDSRKDVQQQIAKYHEQVTNNFPGTNGRHFEPIDVPGTLKKIGSYTDAANELENHAVSGYNVINDATGGKFNAIREENKQAWNAYKGAAGEDAQNAAEKGLETASKHMDDLLSSLRGVVNDRELDGFNDAFRNAQTLRRVGNAIDSSFSGNPSESARSWEYRGFNGQSLMNGLNRLERTIGKNGMSRVIGRDNLDTLYQVAELNRTQAQRGRFGAAVQPVVQSLMKMHVGPIAAGAYLGHFAGVPYEVGGAAGWAAAAATRKVMNAVLTDPKVAQNLIYAIQYGAKPENYGPFIAGLIQEGRKETTPQ